MRRIEASFRKASALVLRHSQSLARRRQCPSQAKVRAEDIRRALRTKHATAARAAASLREPEPAAPDFDEVS